MNYIHRLQADLLERENALGKIQQDIDCMLAYLHGPKFTGMDSDGERRDWIGTTDLVNWLRETRMLTLR